MVDPVSIRRKQDLADARALAEHYRLKLGAPPSAVTDEVITRLADMVQDERLWHQNEIARFRAELEADVGEARERMMAGIAQVQKLLDATEAFMRARKALDAALASTNETLKELATEWK